MLSKIQSFFENRLKLDKNESAAAAADKLHLACAALMLELCQADHAMDASEKATLVDILKRTFGLGDGALETLFELAAEEARNATSLYQFTTLINTSYGHAERVKLLEHMWEIAYADGRIDRYEEHLIRKVAELMYMTHGDFIRAKLASKPSA